jgi:glutamate-1-semialdehyde 2,1-aminomutase
MEFKNKVLAIIQARYNSTRLPGKVVKRIYNNFSVLEILIKRLSKSKYVSKIIVACSNNINDKAIVDICNKAGIDYFIGSENDVLGRFYNASKKYNFSNIVRITADCPLIDPNIVDEVIYNYFIEKADYASNVNPPTFPDGLDVEIFKFSVLRQAYIEARQPHEREHVTPFIINNKKFKKYNLENFKNYSSLRLTLDETEDFNLIQKIIRIFSKNLYFNLNDIIKLYKNKKKIFLVNNRIKRNEGSSMNIGQKMWQRAKKVIPGGTMLFSKNPDLFLPKFWPAYFEKTKGCHVWDLQGNKYLDFSMMGVGTNTLGYSRKEVDRAVRNIIDKGNMSTLNSKEEVLLAEKLIEMHPWSRMVKFTRTGGEASAVAVRIARAASGKNNVAICGYHGWHDWYLSANLSDSNNLNSHLMRNLPIRGVNQKLKNSIFAFEYNKLDQLRDIIKKNNIGVLIMEVSRNENPESNFLEKIRSLTKEKNIVLIFDECTSGFRETYGGLHLKYKISPDIAIFGKALGNGYAVNAVVGNYEIMKYAESTFISSTFWTERIGSAAALATLELMKKIKSWEIISATGLKIKKNWLKISNSHKLKIKIEGLDALPRFNFDSKFNLYYKTFITQEFLKKNFLASNVIYTCTEHNPKSINQYFEILDDIFYKIKKTKHAKEDFKLNLDGPCCIGSLRDKSYDKK